MQIGTPSPPLVIFADDFEYGTGESFANNWTVTGNWDWVAGQAHSPTHSAYSGGTALDNFTYLTLRNPVDLSYFPEASLNWWHRNDFTDGPVFINANVAVSVDGGAWQDLWQFDFVNAPASVAWSENVTSLAAYATGGVKVRFGAHGHAFFQDVPYWWIDDLVLTSPDDREPPYFKNTTVLPDTISTGPFTVQSQVTDHSGATSVSLYHRANAGSWDLLTMTPQGGNNYEAQIPAQLPNSTVDYYLQATDGWGTPNTGADPRGRAELRYLLVLHPGSPNVTPFINSLSDTGGRLSRWTSQQAARDACVRPRTGIPDRLGGERGDGEL